jgi:hypothetical protein
MLLGQNQLHPISGELWFTVSVLGEVVQVEDGDPLVLVDVVVAVGVVVLSTLDFLEKQS